MFSELPMITSPSEFVRLVPPSRQWTVLPDRNFTQASCMSFHVERSVAIHYKGSGFYTTDYGKGAEKKDGGSDSSGGESKAGESGKKDSKPAEKKAAAGSD